MRLRHAAARIALTLWVNRSSVPVGLCMKVPPRVEYSLTELGESLNEALKPLGDWGEAHMERIAERRRARQTGAR